MKNNHVYLTELENSNKLNYSVDAHSLLIDIKILLKEYYLATFNEEGNRLIIKFNNGQKFKLTLTDEQ